MSRQDKSAPVRRKDANPLAQGNDAEAGDLAERVRGLRNRHSRPPGWPFPAPRVRQPEPDRQPPNLEPEP